MGTSLACGRSTPLGLILPLAGLFAALGSSCKGPGTPDPPELQRPRAGIVVAEQPLAVEVGRRVLEQGGNAADAAVATALVPFLQPGLPVLSAALVALVAERVLARRAA